MKIALIQAPVWGVNDPPLGLSLIAACLKRGGHDVRVFDLNIGLYAARREKYAHAWAIEQSMLWSRDEFVDRFIEDNRGLVEDAVRRIRAYGPGLVSFSLTSASKEASIRLARMFKDGNAPVPVVFGGHLMMEPRETEIETMLLSGPADYIVLGEGEATFVELAGLLERGGEPSACPGICFAGPGRTVVRTPRREPVPDLDALPYLDFSDTPLEAYENPGWLGKHLTFQSSRGCLWKCAFCCSTNFWRGFRGMSGKRIYDEIRHHAEGNPGIRHVEFMDLLFNADMRCLEEFCDCMIERPLASPLTWHANAVVRPEMTAGFMRKMRRAGCIRLTYGVESGSQRVLDSMRKKFRIRDADDVLRHTHEAGIESKVNFMFGFPGETEEDFRMTLDFLERNARCITTAYPSFSFCVIEPNSYLESHMEEFGIVPNPDDNLYWESKDGTNTYPERMRRWETFTTRARALGVDVGIGLDTSIEMHKNLNLAYYYKSRNDHERARGFFARYLESDPRNKAVIDEMSALRPGSAAS